MKHAKETKTVFRFAPAVVFIVFIFGMAIWFLVGPKSDYSSSEKRYLKDFPEVKTEKVLSGKFGEEFESYFADHFPERNVWVGVNSYYALFTGNNGANGVYNCKDGYLINKPVSTDNNLEKNFNAIADFKKTVNNVPVTAIFAPSTGYVAEDVLPTVHDKYNDDTYFENAKSIFGKSGVNFVDLRQPFKTAQKNGTQLYYKTDHHWTTAGAYTAYRELCSSLNIQPVEKSAFDIERYGDFYGTTYSTSGFWMTPSDTIEVWNNKANTDKNIRVKITEDAKTSEYGSMFFYDHIKEDDKYPVFIDGNHALTEITNSNAKGGTIVVVKDSFSHSMAPFLAENYKKVILVDMRYYKQSVSQIVEKEKAEQVVVLYGIDNIATDNDIVWLM